MKISKLEEDEWDLSYIASLDKLEYLDISQNAEIFDISPLKGKVKLLQTLDIWGTGISDVSVLSDFTSLTDVQLPSSVTDISPLKDLPNLKSIGLVSSSVPWQQILALKSASSLEELNLNCSTPTNPLGLDLLQNLKSLKSLSVHNCGLTDITASKNLTNLELLNIGLNPIRDLTSVSDLKKLKALLASATKVQSVAPLKVLTSLARLVLNSAQIEDVSPLAGLADLVSLDIEHNKVCSFASLETLEKEHQNSSGKIIALSILGKEEKEQACAAKSDGFKD